MGDQPSKDEIKAAHEKKAETIAEQIGERLKRGGKPHTHRRPREDNNGNDTKK
jgi:hypothetical protein